MFITKKKFNAIVGRITQLDDAILGVENGHEGAIDIALQTMAVLDPKFKQVSNMLREKEFAQKKIREINGRTSPKDHLYIPWMLPLITDDDDIVVKHYTKVIEEINSKISDISDARRKEMKQ